jgi:hypothetical protein
MSLKRRLSASVDAELVVVQEAVAQGDAENLSACQ